MNTELRKKTKDDFEKYFLKLTNNSVFGKNMENERKQLYIKLATTEKKEKLFGVQTKLSYKKIFLKKYNSNRNKETQIFKSKPVQLSLSIIKISKIVTYDFWYETKSCYMDADSFISHVKTEDIYKDTGKDTSKRKKNKKVIALMKHVLDEKIIKDYAGLKQKHIAI